MGKAIAAFDDFKIALDARASDIQSVLPSHVSMARFRAVALSAASQKPEILACTPNTLFGSLTKAATDGLLPDGREGVILSHRTKHKYRDAEGKWRERWTDDATWIPMVHGQRKRAKELENIIVDSDIIFAADHFVFARGDNPRLEHEPAALADDPGDALGAYSIYRIDGQIVHREVMRTEQIMAARKKSKNPDGMLWVEFWTEGWRKTVIKRGFKAVPVGESLDRLIERDNEMYTLDGDGTVIDHTPTLPPTIGPRRNGNARPAQVVSGASGAPPPAVGETARPNENPEPAEGTSEPIQPDAWLDEYDRAQSTQEESTDAEG